MNIRRASGLTQIYIGTTSRCSLFRTQEILSLPNRRRFTDWLRKLIEQVKYALKIMRLPKTIRPIFTKFFVIQNL
ncbi:hypothetical protein D9V87_05560 [Bacteroidetes/Chlorobi group bacterium MS-B_bin-24]|nr:MAG: hypothetical protein D9V87_05560 [Bacteroidetes/Chlorobi group bacterium MS-B_bin-24]